MIIPFCECTNTKFLELFVYALDSTEPLNLDTAEEFSLFQNPSSNIDPLTNAIEEQDSFPRGYFPYIVNQGRPFYVAMEHVLEVVNSYLSCSFL